MDSIRKFNDPQYYKGPPMVTRSDGLASPTCNVEQTAPVLWPWFHQWHKYHTWPLCVIVNYERNEDPEASRVTSLYLGNL